MFILVCFSPCGVFGFVIKVQVASSNKLRSFPYSLFPYSLCISSLLFVLGLIYFIYSF